MESFFLSGRNPRIALYKIIMKKNSPTLVRENQTYNPWILIGIVHDTVFNIFVFSVSY